MSIVPAGRVSRAVGPLLALLVVCAVPAMAQMADCMDNARQTIDAGGTNGVASVFAVDLDGDGDIDVLSASTNDDTIAWYEAPLFNQHVISADADGASSVYAVDLDQDDDIDVLSASATDRTIAWYENDGSMPPRFVKRAIGTDARGALSVYATDIDNDGDIDVLSASFEDNKIALFVSDLAENPLSTPGFTELVISTDQLGAASVYADFVNDDMLMDIVSASRLDNKVTLFQNAGTFCSTLRLTSCAMNAECVPPCVVACLGLCEGDDCVEQCDEDCASATCFPYFDPIAVTTTAAGATSVFTADVDGDMDVDILSASSTDNRIAWYRQDDLAGEIVFVKQVISTVALGASSVFAIDMDQDLDIDVLSASRFDETIGWYENLGGGSFGDPVINRIVISADAPGANSVFAIDMDQDLDIDVLSASSVAGLVAADDMITLHENIAVDPMDPTFASITISDTAIAPPALLAVNVDEMAAIPFAGGSPLDTVDVLAANDVDNTIGWYSNDGLDPPGFTFMPLTEDAPQVRSLFWADLDGDMNNDLLAALSAVDSIGWYRNLGGGDFGDPATNRINIAQVSADGASGVFAADLDGDMLLDVISASANDNKIAWYPNLGGGDFGDPISNQRLISNTADGAQSVYAIDIDGDGDLDVLAASSNDNTVAWYENENQDPNPPLFSQHVITSFALGARSVVGSDIDDDGDNDVVVGSSVDNRVIWFSNLGRRCDEFSVVVPVMCEDDPECETEPCDLVCVCEDVPECVDDAECILSCATSCLMDCDEGDTECEEACTEDCAEDRCERRFSRFNISFLANFVQQVLAADIDADGLMDVVSISSGDSSASWYQQNEPLLNPETCQTAFSFTERPITTSARNGRAIAVNTINSDAALDVVTGFSFEVAWHEGFVAEECVTFDVTGDGEMDGAELSQMAGAFGLRCEEETNPVIIAWCESVDYDLNQEVDGNDLSILTSTGVWGRCIAEVMEICELEDLCSFTCP